MATEGNADATHDFLAFRDSQKYDVNAVSEYASLATALAEQIDGEVRFDEYSQILYATDGSIYQAKPAGVVIPRSIEDVQAAVVTAREHDVPVLPRGAGSSLAGQTVGPGCIVIDFSKYMDDIQEIDVEEKTATVQPGVVQDDLDAALAQYGLKFAPDPASSNRATIGGGIGNNSTGAHSVRYGITDAYTEELSVVLADGSLITTREIVIGSDEWEEILAQDNQEAEIYRTVREVVDGNEKEIESRYPNLKRTVSGYNLNRVIYENDAEERCINLSKLLVGSEGTLGIVVESTVDLVSKPDDTALAVYCFDDLIDALAAVPVVLEHDVSAVELMDEEVFRLASESDGYAAFVDPIPTGTAAAIMVEVDSELQSDFTQAIAELNTAILESGDAFDVIEAYEPNAQEKLWKLRKAAIPLLMSLDGDPKPYPFIEDATVPPSELAEYVEKFQEILEDHGTSAAYFAHAGSGTLHIRPILNLKQDAGIQTMRSIADDVTSLVLEHHGSFSGEHGDGMARTEFNPKMYGQSLWDGFKTIKTAFDPEWLLHPGNVVYRDSEEDIGPDSTRGVGADMRDHLRYGASYQSIEPQTTLDFTDNGSFAELVELCNGCGTCRQTGQDTMCPTYRASKDEMETTRGRANMLRAAISGELPQETLYSEWFQQEVLDLCVGCKGCMNDCPTGVDLAKLKAEVKHQYHQEEGSSLRDWLFAHIDTVSMLGSRFAPISNWGQQLPGARVLLEKSVGIARNRTLPSFTATPFSTWMNERSPRVSLDDATHKVLLFPDTYTEYSDPEIGKAAVRVLESLGCHVDVVSNVKSSGRAPYSKGFLDEAREIAEQNIDELAPWVERGWSVVCLEPSDVSMFHDEYFSLLEHESVNPIAAETYGIFEFLNTYNLVESLDVTVDDRRLTYHGHCNQKALNEAYHAPAVLEQCGFSVDVLDSGCCGMAGSFGYESEHFGLSKSIGSILVNQVTSSDGRTVIAPGVSCRTQLKDSSIDSPIEHPIETLAGAVTDF